MRVSTKVDDPGFFPKVVRYHVYLDGEEVKDCHTADDEAGIAIVYVRDSNGLLYLDKSGDLAEKVLVGKIEIKETEAA